MTNMDLSGTTGQEDRIAALEKKTGDLEALVKGLTAEMLDFKAIAMTLARQEKEQRRTVIAQVPAETVPAAMAEETAPATASQENRTVVRPRSAPKPEAAAAPAEPDMVRIMQSDGTMKMEVRRGDKKLR